MNRCAWIVCERAGRWAAALRTTLARHTSMPGSAPRLVEVRRLGEMTEWLELRPMAMGLIEVRGDNVATVLRWLADARHRHPYARFLALVDHSLASPDETPPMESALAGPDVVAALWEAGAVDIATSPRLLGHVLAIARQHWRVAARQTLPPAEQPLLDWALARLPGHELGKIQATRYV